MERAARIVCFTVAVALVSACSDEGDTVTAGDDPTTTTTTGATTSSPDAPVGLVLQIRTGGGFLPTELSFATIPQLTLFGDGRVITTGPTTLEYPGRALPNVLTGRVGDDDVRAAVSAAREAGVAGEPDLGRPTVADAPTTTFVLVDGGRTHVLDAYALDLDGAPGLTDAQGQARLRLRRLVERMTELGGAATQQYRAAAVSVLVTPYPEPEDRPVEPEPGEADWPLGDLGSGGTEQLGGRCLGYTGAEAERVLAAAGDARSNTRWRSAGAVWALVFRPELPGVEPCSTD